MAGSDTPPNLRPNRRGQIPNPNPPEPGDPCCPQEVGLVASATARLTELLNAGPFTLAAGDRDHDRYGRALRVVSRGGESLGDTLTAEGLAEPWRGRRGDWCGRTGA